MFGRNDIYILIVQTIRVLVRFVILLAAHQKKSRLAVDSKIEIIHYSLDIYQKRDGDSRSVRAKFVSVFTSGLCSAVVLPDWSPRSGVEWPAVRHSPHSSPHSSPHALRNLEVTCNLLS